MTTTAKKIAWDRLTSSQRLAANQLARLVEAAVDASHLTDVSEGSQVAFLSGRRGTGKTGILQLFQEAIESPKTTTFLPAQSLDQVQKLVARKEQIFWLPPIQLDPLPPGSNITGAVFARITDASQFGGRDGQRAAGVLDSTGGLDRARNRLNSLQAKALLAIEGNLEQRKGAIDQDTFAVNVMDNERARPTIRSKLSGILDQVIARGSEEHISRVEGLYVIVIDDIDIRPSRAIEALQLATLLAIPRLFFIFSGEIDTVDQLLLYRTQSEFLTAFGEAGPDSFLRNDIEGRSNEIASSLLRKLIPPKRHVPVGSVEFGDATDDNWPGIGKARVLPLGSSRYSESTWDLKALTSPQWDVPGAERILCVAPRQLKDLGEALRDAEPVPSSLLSQLWSPFKTLVDEDRKLGIPAQRKLKEMLDFSRDRVIFPVDGLTIEARFGEGVTVEIEAEISVGTGPSAIATVRGSTVLNRELRISAGARDGLGETEERPFGPDSAAMYMLLHDICAISESLGVEGDLYLTENSRTLLAHTRWETLDGTASRQVPWHRITWPTFWHQQIFLHHWNQATRQVRAIQQEPSEVSGDAIAKLLAIGYAQAVLETGAMTFGHEFGPKERVAGHLLTRKPGASWKFETAPEAAIKSSCGKIADKIDNLVKVLIDRAVDGKEDAIFELGIAMVVEVYWLFGDHVHVLAKHRGRLELGNLREVVESKEKKRRHHEQRVKLRIYRTVRRYHAQTRVGWPEKLGGQSTP